MKKFTIALFLLAAWILTACDMSPASGDAPDLFTTREAYKETVEAQQRRRASANDTPESAAVCAHAAAPGREVYTAGDGGHAALCIHCGKGFGDILPHISGEYILSDRRDISDTIGVTLEESRCSACRAVIDYRFTPCLHEAARWIRAATPSEDVIGFQAWCKHCDKPYGPVYEKIPVEDTP